MSDLPLSATLPFQARIRKSPFFNALRRAGCTSFGVYNRTYTPMGFHDPQVEYDDLRNGVVLWPASGERQVEVRGPDAARFVQLLTPRDLSKCAVGQCKYVLVTADDGGIVNDPVLLKLAEDRFWLSAADSDLWLYARGVNALARMDVTISDPEVSVLAIQGPGSVELMTDLVGESVADMKHFWCRRFDIDGIPTIISRTGWSSEWGYEIYLLDPTAGDRLFDHITDTGKAHDLKLGVVSQISRVEGGMLSLGADMGLTENPFEVGLGWTVNFDNDNEFIGRDALTQIARDGAKRTIVGVVFDGDPIRGFIEPWPLRFGNEGHSQVTSLCWSPTLNKNIGLALLPTEHASPETPVVLETPDGDVRGTTRQLPLVPKRHT